MDFVKFLEKRVGVDGYYQKLLKVFEDDAGEVEDNVACDVTCTFITYGIATECIIQCARDHHRHSSTIGAMTVQKDTHLSKNQQFTANYQLVMAMNEIGRGQSHAETILAFMNHPSSSIKYCYYQIQDLLATDIEKASRESMTNHLTFKREMTMDVEGSNALVDGKGNIGITGSLDMHWVK